MEKKNTWLPEKFLDEMKELLGDEYEAFLASYDEEHMRGMRCNSLKLTPSEFEEKAPFISGSGSKRALRAALRRSAYTGNGGYHRR